MLIYDIEIECGVPPEDQTGRQSDIKYAKDWTDYVGMGVTVIGVYDYVVDEWHTFGEYTLKEFKKLADSHDVCVGFNNLGFDNNLLKAYDIVLDDRRCYDILAEIYRTLGGRRKGCRLGDVCRVNFNADKSGDGADAPVQWQRGNYVEVIDYCLHDVRLTKKIVDRILRQGWINNPVSPDQRLYLPRPNRK